MVCLWRVYGLLIVSAVDVYKTFLRSREDGLCLELPGADTSEGNHLAVSKCNGGASQIWSFQLDRFVFAGAEVVTAVRRSAGLRGRQNSAFGNAAEGPCTSGIVSVPVQQSTSTAPRENSILLLLLRAY